MGWYDRGQVPPINGKQLTHVLVTIYDLDGTLLRRATYTPFLLFAGRRLAPWRLILAPGWVLLMVAHKAGLVGRARLKAMGLRLLVGRPTPDRLDRVAMAFATGRLGDLQPGAQVALARDRREGRLSIIATAAYEFYARHIAAGLQVPHLIASERLATGITPPNCYGPEKLVRVERWLAEQGAAPDHIRFYSDSFADAPLLDRVDDPVFVTRNPRKAARAAARGWRVEDFSEPGPA